MTSIGPIGQPTGPIRGDSRDAPSLRRAILTSAGTANETPNGEANARATEARARNATTSGNLGGDVGGVVDLRG